MLEILTQVLLNSLSIHTILVFQDDGSLLTSKPAKKSTARTENTDALSLGWSDVPNNEPIRPSRRLGPQASRESG